MKILLIIPLVGMISTIHCTIETNPILSSEFIAEINANAFTWTARQNFDETTPMSRIKRLFGARLPINASQFLETKPPVPVDVDSIPSSFDARQQWAECRSLHKIRDQSNCGSCWSVSTASVISDRICIHSNGTKNYPISAIDLTACCGLNCGTCGGGWAELAFKYWVEHGLVSGGAYNSKEGCKPYPFSSCRDLSFESVEGDNTPACVRRCDDARLDYASDLNKGRTSYHVSRSVEQIQIEIMTNGPVVAGMTVYQDFISYEGGVYHNTTDKIEGGHYVRLLGWGVENDTPYWLGANSWCDIWGEKGFFKILRGNDESGIEHDVFAGMP